ncbi:MAG: LLM class flavin-dependent oxidoreductase [Dehalococcoidia bacterium]|nr:LLM class flavin-dependent oxidoreductase [Dehalococcoidia bacterium]
MIGIVLREPKIPHLIEQIVEAEAAGVPAVWLTTAGSGRDALTVFAAAAMRTANVKLGASILPTWPRHPIAVAQQAQVVASLAPGRLRIGLGVANEAIKICSASSGKRLLRIFESTFTS